MEIIKKYENRKEGNDCLITNYICLIKLDYHLYLLTHTESVYGGWTGNPKTTQTRIFEDYGDALICMVTLIGKLERE